MKDSIRFFPESLESPEAARFPDEDFWTAVVPYMAWLFIFALTFRRKNRGSFEVASIKPASPDEAGCHP